MGYFTQILVPTVWERLIELISAPALNPQMMWIISPLIITLLLMTFYFGRYTKEELGWNTAIGNSIVLLFVAIDLLRYVFNLSTPGSIINYELHPISTIICLIVMAESLTLMFTSFFKALPKTVTFFLCAPLPVNLQAYLAVVIVYTNVKLDGFTLVAAIVLFIILYFIIKLLQVFERWFIKTMRTTSIAELKEEQKIAKEKIKEAAKEEKSLAKIEQTENNSKQKYKKPGILSKLTSKKTCASKKKKKK
jgi:hypothetical protein